MEAKLYELLGGYVGYRKTPLRIIQRQSLRIIAVMNYEGEQAEEAKQKQAEQEEEMRQRMTETYNRR